MRIRGMNLETDRDIAVCLRNMALAISEISKATGYDISLFSHADGYASARVGDYVFTKLCEGEEWYRYEPLEGLDIDKWKTVTPSEINDLGGAPRCTRDI